LNNEDENFELIHDPITGRDIKLDLRKVAKGRRSLCRDCIKEPYSCENKWIKGEKNGEIVLNASSDEEGFPSIGYCTWFEHRE
jgi:hypothetical protein